MIGLDWLNGSPARNQCFFLGRQQDAVRLSLTVAGAVSIDRLGAKLLVADVIGGVRNLPRTALASLFDPGDLVVANDAATLPASLRGTHRPSSEAAEVRLAAWVRLRDPERFIVIVFGAGDHRQRTEDRPPPPQLCEGDRSATAGFEQLQQQFSRALADQHRPR
jgi:hypothetical protein